MGIRVVMLTGDNERTAKAIGAQAGVDEVIAGVLPDGKESVIRSLKEQGRVAMVETASTTLPPLQEQTSESPSGPNRYRYRRGGRCSYEKSAKRCSRGYPAQPGDAEKHPRESVLGVLLQRDRNPSRRRRMDPRLRLDTESHVRRGGNEPVQLLRSHKRLRLNFFKIHDASGTKKSNLPV